MFFFLIGFPAILKLLQTPLYLGVMRLAMVASLASFQAPTTLSRLITLALGNGVTMLNFTAMLWHPNRSVRYWFYTAGRKLSIHLVLQVFAAFANLYFWSNVTSWSKTVHLRKVSSKCKLYWNIISVPPFVVSLAGGWNRICLTFYWRYIWCDHVAFGLGHAKMCLMPCSLISTFVVRCLDSVICILAISKVSRF